MLFKLDSFCILCLLYILPTIANCEKVHINREHLKHPYTFKTKNYEIVIPKRVNSRGAHVSHAMEYKYNGNEDEGLDLHVSVPIRRLEHHLHLRPTRHLLLRPSTSVESYKHPIHVEKRRFKPSKHLCHYTGHVRGHGDQRRTSLSACNGLTGYIHTDDGLFMIEPAYPDQDHAVDIPHPHRLYKHSANMSRESPATDTGDRCGRNVEDEIVAVAEYFMEVLLVLDHSFLRYHKAIDVEDYILTIMNMAHDLYLDETLGVTVNIVIVRLIRLENEEHEMNLDSNHNVEKTMQYFRDWQRRINPKDDTHPNHHDLAILVTRTDICNNEKTCGFMGASRFGGMCDEDNSAIIVRDCGLLTGFIIAHELGHTMNLIHDINPPSIEMNPLQTPQFTTTVMSPEITGAIFNWSNCSSQRLKNFLKYGFGDCMLDEPNEHTFRAPDTLPGVLFDGEYQCKTMFGPNAALCMTGIDCKNLICYVEDKGCIETQAKLAEGTQCDEHKWCFHGECVEQGERPDAVHGNWSEWNEWSECSRTCGSGVARQRRTCNNPPPKNGGKFCVGDSVRYKICSTDPCDDNQPSFRDTQCADFNSWVYPGDGKMHSWTSYPAHDENPCALYCVSESGSIASLRTRVIDGTTCYRSVRHVCIKGLCKEIPCDLNLESGAVEDRCGVCKGDGTSCDVITAEVSLVCSTVYENEKRLIAIPEKSFNIKVESMKPSATKFEIRSANDSDVLLDGSNIGVTKVYNSTAWVGMIRQKQEAINVPGPIPKGITVWAYIEGNTTVKYSFGVPSTKKRTPKFNWEHVHWTPCSTECGPGVQESPARCVEASAGLVSDHHCKSVLQPIALIRSCEIAPCTPRWLIGEWTPCMHCPAGSRYRIVKCYRPVGSDEGELDFISDSHCTSSKPRTIKSCNCIRRKRAVTGNGLMANTSAQTATTSTGIPSSITSRDITVGHTVTPATTVENIYVYSYSHSEDLPQKSTVGVKSSNENILKSGHDQQLHQSSGTSPDDGGDMTDGSISLATTDTKPMSHSNEKRTIEPIGYISNGTEIPSTILSATSNPCAAMETTMRSVEAKGQGAVRNSEHVTTTMDTYTNSTDTSIETTPILAGSSSSTNDNATDPATSTTGENSMIIDQQSTSNGETVTSPSTLAQIDSSATEIAVNNIGFSSSESSMQNTEIISATNPESSHKDTTEKGMGLQIATKFALICSVLPESADILGKATAIMNESKRNTNIPLSSSETTSVSNEFREAANIAVGRSVAIDLKRNPENVDANQEMETNMFEATKPTSDKPKITGPHVKTLQDFVDIPKYKLTIHTSQQKGDLSANIPHSRRFNTSTFDITGMDALKFLHSIQRDFSNNKTRI